MGGYSMQNGLISRKEVEAFYTNLHKLRVGTKYTPKFMVNMDETFTSSTKPTIIFLLKMLPKSAKPFLHTFNISGSSKGWMNRKVFLSWVTESFIPEIHRRRAENGTPDAPALLLLDNHNLRANFAALRALQKAHIDVQTLPAHTFHILQPLDQEVNLIYKKVLGELLSFKDTATADEKRQALLEAALHTSQEALLARHVLASFSHTGIWPLDDSKGLESKYVVADVPAPRPEAAQRRLSMENKLITEENFILELAKAEAEREVAKVEKRAQAAAAAPPIPAPEAARPPAKRPRKR
eukprot:m51a1_g7307 hypothetical protein (296) ;mRNA; r:107581-108597